MPKKLFLHWIKPQIKWNYINAEKIKYMLVAINNVESRTIPGSGEHRIEPATKFVYLGSLVDNNNDMSKEIKRRKIKEKGN